MPEQQTFLQAFQEAIQLVPIQVRDPSSARPPFWANTITITRARPIPADGAWHDLLTIPVLPGHPRVVDRFVATSQNEGLVQFRWAVGNHLLSADQFALTAGIERHLDRFQAHPYPCAPRAIYMRFGDAELVRLQALNLDAAVQLAFASVLGWYYPALGATNEVTGAEGIDDAVRSF